VFFPVGRLPAALQGLAWFTPLFHGVELVRGVVLGTVEPVAAMIHVAYLSAMLSAGIAVGVRTFTRKLRT
jgi:lipooligosaccharide transport system permease protein